MSQIYANDWQTLRRARDKLIAKFIQEPDVTLIGIGRSKQNIEAGITNVLRVYVRSSWFQKRPEDRINFPKQVDGIPVVVSRGEFDLETQK